MLYLDTAALVKLIRREEASDALIDWLSARSDVRCSPRAWSFVRPARASASCWRSLS